ncbi:MAG TPA: hypothetical protein VFA26_18665 [Gemmataceae bacterium]|nr:hypothetical protein [Gemmataceae bacterium]
MTRILVDETLRNKFNNLTEPLELCDDSGRLLGQFVPAFDPSEWERWEPEISEEELRRLGQSGEKRCTAAEMLGVPGEAAVYRVGWPQSALDTLVWLLRRRGQP